MRQKHRLTYASKLSLKGFLFVCPWLVGFLFLFLRPFISAVVYSFNDMEIVAGQDIQYTFVGLKHYIYAFSGDEFFPQYLPQALGKLAYQLPLVLFFSLFMATVLNQKFLSRSFYRVVFFLPTIIASGVVLGIIRGDTMYDAMQAGGDKATYMFQALSVQDILLSLNLAPSLVSFITTVLNSLMELFWYSGIQMLIFLAGLQNISPSLREAALIDGASSWDYFWLITFPLISPLILTNAIYTIIATFTDYTNPVMAYMNKIAGDLQTGFASAMAMIYFVISFSIILAVYFVINRKVFYRNG